MITLLKNWYYRHFSQPGTIEFALVLLASFIVVYYFMWLVGPLVVALCLAFCLDWLVESLNNKFKISRKIGSIIVMLGFSGFLILLGVVLVPTVIKQGAEFYNSLVAFSIEDAAAHKKHNEGTNGNDASHGSTIVKSNDHNTPISNKGSETLSSPSLSLNNAHPSLNSDPYSPNSHINGTNAKGSLSSAGLDHTTPQKTSPASSLTDVKAAAALRAAAAAHGVSSAKDNKNVDSAAPESKEVSAGATTVSLPDSGTSVTVSTGNDGSADGSDTTIVYISEAKDNQQEQVKAKQDTNGSKSSRSAAANDAANALGVIAGHPESSKVTTAGNKTVITDNKGYQITVINGSNQAKAPLGTVGDDESEFVLTVNDFDIRIAHEINDIVSNMPEPMPSMVTMTMLKEGVRNARVAATNKIAELMRTKLMPSVFNAFTWMVYALIVPIFTFLMLYNKDVLQTRAATFLLPNNQRLMREFWPSMQAQISGYIRGKFFHIIIIGIANSIAFMLMGVNYSILLGVGVGLSVVIPYVGAVIIAVPVVLVAVFQFGFSPELLWILIIYTVIQLLDSNILTPMLFSKAMNLDAFSILAAILIFGNLWGFWGVFFAIPLATFIKTLIVQWPNADPHDQFGNPVDPKKHDSFMQQLASDKLRHYDAEGYNMPHDHSHGGGSIESSPDDEVTLNNEQNIELSSDADKQN